MNLTSMVREYKQSNSSQILDSIFIQIQPILKKKAQYIYYHKKFKGNKYSFTIAQTKKLDYEDVLQELNMEILRIVQEYNPKKEFEPYFFATLWNWRPQFLKQGNFLQWLGTTNESEMGEDEGENLLEQLAIASPILEPANLMDFFEDLTEEEKSFLNLCIKNKDKNQSQLSEIIGVTQPRVSQIVANLRKKLKVHL